MTTPLRDVVGQVLDSPRLPHAVLLLALTLTAPSLFVGLQFDDYLLQSTISRDPSPTGVMERLFAFMDGDPSRTLAKMESGAFPWFTLPEGKVAFWRPISALTHWVDARLWPDRPLLMHLQSLLWFGLLVGVVGWFFRQFFEVSPGDGTPLASERARWSVRAAGLATLLYALDDARGFAVGWLANRNALIATVLGVLALIAHHRWREMRWRFGPVLSPLFFGLALLAGESAVAVLGYLVAYALFLDPAERWHRARSLLPHLAVLIVWRVVYASLGFGAWGTSYIDPLREPARYAGALLERGPLLLLGQWAFPPAELHAYLPPRAATGLSIVAAVAVLLLGALFLPALRRSALARFFGLGMMLAVLPPCAAQPANRLLFFVGLGGFGLLALAATHLDRRPVVQAMVGLHLLQMPLLGLMAWSPALFGSVETSLASLPDDPGLAEQSMIFVNPPSHFHVGFLGDIRARNGRPTPARMRVLASGRTTTTIERSDGRTLVVRPEDGFVVGFEAVFRGRGRPLAVGDIVRLSDVDIEVLALTRDQRPSVVAFRFHVPLEDPALRWRRWEAEGTTGRYVSFELPAVGDVVTLTP